MARPRIDRLRKLPWGALGMILLVALVERGLARAGGSYRTLLSWNGHIARRAAATDATGAKVVFLGDSLVKLGLLPAVVDGRSARPSYNLAVLAGEPPGTYFLLRRVVESGGRPEAIVVDFAPNLSHLDPRTSLPVLAEQWDAREAIDLALAARDPDFFARWAASAYLPSARHRDALRERAAAALKGPEAIDPIRLQSERQAGKVRRHWAIHRGATVLSGPGVTLPMPPNLEDPYLRVPYEVHPLNVSYIDRLLDFADAHHIRVYWLLPACVAETQAKREALGIDAAISAFVRSRQARHPGLVAIDARHAGFPHEFFVDGGHLNRRGASVQSRLVGDLLRSEFPERWALLPSVPDRAEDVSIEDFDDSSRIAEARSASARR